MIYIWPVYGQAESGGLFSKLMMMMMKNRRRTYVPFPVPFSPLSYSSIIPINYPATLPIGGYPNFRSSLISSLSNGGHLGPLSPLGGLGPFSLGALPLISSLRGDTKFLSRSSPIYEPTVASSSIVPSYAVAVAPPPAVSTPAASTNSFLITSPTAISNSLATNPLTAAAINSLLPSITQPALSAPVASNSPSPLNVPLLPTSTNTFSNANSLSLTNSSPLTNPNLSNSHLSTSHSFSSTNPTLLSSSNATTYSYAASNGNNLTEKNMSGTQGELIKQELKEHHLNNIRIQYLKSLRDHLIKDQLLKEQYLKELTKKSSIVYPYLEMYDELGNK